MMNLSLYRDENIILTEINKIVSSENYIEVIAEILLRDFAGSVKKIELSNPAEILNYNELAFLIGTWIKNYNNQISPNAPEILIEQTDDLLLEYHQSMFFNNFDLSDMDKSAFEIFDNGSLFKETFFYSSTAGYDTQYITLLCEKYKYDKEWLKSSRNIDIELLSPFFDMVKGIINNRLWNLQRQSKKISSKEKVNIFIFNNEELLGAKARYKPIVESLTLQLSNGVNNQFLDIADFNEFLVKPIIKIDSEKYFIPSPYFIAESLYESPFYWMNEDKAYKAISANNRGNGAEDIVFRMLSKVFAKDKIDRNVKIKINSTKTLTDIDVMVQTEEFVIIFQIKSKKLTALSKKGELEAIKSDFSKAVVDANKQAEISIKALQDFQRYTFENINPSKLNHISNKKFLTVIVLLDQYPAITHQTHILLGETMETPPIAFSIFDLETLLIHLQTSEKFGDYIDKRTQYSKFYRSANEMQYLGYYLKHGMKKPSENEMVYIPPTYGTDIDASQHKKAVDKLSSKIPAIGRNQPCPCGSGKKFKHCHLK